MLADCILFDPQYLTYFPDEVAKGILYIADHVVPTGSQKEDITVEKSTIKFILQCWREIKNTSMASRTGAAISMFTKYNNLADTPKGIVNPITYYRISTDLY